MHKIFTIRPAPHTEDLPVPVPPQQYILDSDYKPTENREKTPQPSTSTDFDFNAAFKNLHPKGFPHLEIRSFKS
jgi:hypothetical protein